MRTLVNNTRNRLEKSKHNAAKANYKNWQTYRRAFLPLVGRSVFKRPRADMFDLTSNKNQAICDPEKYGFRLVHENKYGYYANEYQDEIYKPVVYLIAKRKNPITRKKQSLYAHGYIEGESGYCVLDFDYIYADLDQQKRYADRMAERCAEQAWEYEEHYQAEQTFLELRESVAETKQLLRSIFKERRALRSAGITSEIVCGVIVDRIRGELSGIKKMRKKMTQLVHEYQLNVEALI